MGALLCREQQLWVPSRIAHQLCMCAGILACLDGYMNIAMEQTEVRLHSMLNVGWCVADKQTGQLAVLAGVRERAAQEQLRRRFHQGQQRCEYWIDSAGRWLDTLTEALCGCSALHQHGQVNMQQPACQAQEASRLLQHRWPWPEGLMLPGPCARLIQQPHGQPGLALGGRC